jgi:uncharacterized protein (DUF433 family)
MDWKDRIVADPEVAFGKPRIKGTRMTVEFLMGLFAAGWSEQQVLENYPHLAREDLQAVFALAAEMLSEEEFVVTGKLVA